MSRDTTKSKSRGNPAVRQFRGPGMNQGQKRPRHGTIKQPEPTKASRRVTNVPGESSSRNDYSKRSGSYLSSNLWR